MGCLLAWFLAFSILQRRLTGGTVATAAFYAVYVLTTVALLVVVFKLEAFLDVLVHSTRNTPILFIVFVANSLVFALLVLSIFTQVGLLALLLLASLGAMTVGSFSSDRRFRLTDSVLRSSPLSFLSFYLCLVAGEVFLRFNPRFLGGGGGGNPALRQLYAGLYEMNSFGLRYREFEEARPPGTFRILSTGDSFTFGQGVRSEETYTQQMESLLNRSTDTLRFEVINAGKQGWSTVDELHYVRDEGLNYDPNLITVQFYLNDVAGRFEGRDARVNRLMRKVVMRPFARSYTIFFLRHRFDSATQALGQLTSPSEYRDLIDHYAEIVEGERLGWLRCASALAELGVLSEQTGVPIALIVFPQPGRDIDQSVRTITQAVADRARQAGLQVLDLSEALARVPLEQQIVSQIDYHPSATVHRVAALRIVDFLRTAELVPATPSQGAAVR